MAMEYSASAMVLPDLFPCLNVRKVTTGPAESSTWFFYELLVELFDCFIASCVCDVFKELKINKKKSELR